jgi:hypothetical protein
MTVIINILPNVYWIYNNPNKKLSLQDYRIEVRKFGESINIQTVLELDDNLAFWGKSRDYINEIKIQLEKDEFAKLLHILKKVENVAKTSYTTNSPCIISTYATYYVEIGLAVWIYFFHINANMSFDNVIKMLAYKIIGNVTLSDLTKKFFAFLNLNQLNQ